MRHVRAKPGLCAIALLAVLSGGGVPAGADDPDTPVIPAPPALDEAVAPAPDAEPPPDAPEPAPAGEEALLLAARTDPVALGPLSIGTPDAGLLVNPMPFPEGPYWKVRNPDESWGTDETIAYVVAAIESVQVRYPGSPRLVIGDLSNPSGGRLNRHKSHQAGRDADIGFYYRRGEVDDFLTARKRDLDLPRTWALVRALVTDTDVDRIFVDRSLISLLYAHAVTEGEDRGWLDDIFGRRAEKGIIQHERGHKNHLHVRFFNPRAQEQGRVVYPVLVEAGVAPPPMVKHKVRTGETLGSIARRYGTSVSAIRAANRLRGSQIRAGRSYTIPIRRMPPEGGPVVIPPRRLPPDPQTIAAAPDPGAAGEAAVENR
jgi:penicillin-insensitive murein endopeptidase